MADEIPNVYSIKWQGSVPAGALSIVRLFVAPVAGGHMLMPLRERGLLRVRVIEVTPIGYPFGRAPKVDDYAADLVVADE